MERYRIGVDGALYFITMSVVDWLPVFVSYAEVFARAAGEDRNHRFWQPTLHAETIPTEAFWTQKLDYLHDNPCRKGLVARAEFWRFSSASYWLGDGQTANDVILSAVDW